MGFSAFNVSREMIKFTGNNTPGSKFGNKPLAGGSFTPNTLEASFMLRANLDNQFESAAITKHKQLMQNRLNALVENLRTAYTNLLNVSLGQQIGQEAGTATRSDVRLDGIGTRLVSGNNSFRDYGTDPNNAKNPDGSATTWGSGVTGGGLVSTIGNDDLANDSIIGYSRNFSAATQEVNLQFRSLTANPQAKAAGDVNGSLVISMRAEDVPPNVPAAGGGLGAVSSALSGAFGGPPAPTKFNQKVGQYTAEFKTGGFWSTVNYLNNFAPKEIKYSYAVGYTANSGEAGERNYLDNGRLLDADDVPAGDTISGVPTQSTGTRVKWDSFEPTDGYKTERSGTSSAYPNVYNRTLAFIDSVDANGDMVWNAAPDTAAALKNIVGGVPLTSGTRIYNFTDGFWAAAAGSNLDDRLGITNESSYHLYDALNRGIKLTNEVATGTNPGTSGTRPGTTTSTLFYNHYDVEVRTVDFNNADRGASGQGNVVVNAGMVRSKAIDASKQYQWVDDDGDSSTGNQGKEAISATPGTGQISKSFNGEFIQSIHKIQSYNGVDIVGNELGQASPVIGNVSLGSYEGYLRSLRMSQGLTTYAAPKAIEVNAAESAPTDWFQAESLATDPTLATVNASRVWFPYPKDDNIYWGTPNGTDKTLDQTVEMRNSFQLKQYDLFDLDPVASWGTDENGVRYPSYSRRPYNITVDFNNAGVTNGRLFVNGLYVDPSPGASGDLTSPTTVDISKYLREGDNTISFEGVSTHRDTEGIRITSAGTNDAIAEAAIQSRIITGYESNSEIRFNTLMERPGTSRISSRWQARIVPSTTSAGYGYVDAGATTTSVTLSGNALYDSTLFQVGNPIYIYDPTSGTMQSSSILTVGGASITFAPALKSVPSTNCLVSATPFLSQSSDPLYTGSSSKASNALIELLIKNLNKKIYQDIYKLGLISNLNKMLIQGSASVPSGTSLQGAISMYFDPKTQAIVMNQDRLVGKS